jgi:hypothetical protein
VYTTGVRSLSELAKTGGVLLAMWLVLGLVGWLGGAFPTSTTSPAPVDAPGSEDAGAPPPDAAAALDAGPPPDAWAPPSVEAPPPPAGPPTTVLCDAPDEVLWGRGALAGDARAELVVGCAEGPEVFGFVGDALVRIARLRPVRPTPLRAARFADVDGDGQPDVVLAFGEGLFWVPRDAAGGLAEPRVLAPSRHGALATASMDATPGEEIAVIHGDAPRPELWLFRGGPAPVRTASVPAPLDTSAIAIVDLDVDGHLDVVAVGAQQILVAFGDSRGELPRTRSLAPGGRGLVVRTGEPSELVVERADGACALVAAPAQADGGTCTPLEGATSDVRGLATVGDRLVGWRHPDLVTRGPSGGWEVAGTLATTTFGVHAFALDPHDAEQRVWLLGSATRDGRRTLETLALPLDAPFTLHDGPTQGVADGPLPLAIALPDPNSPR